MDIQPNIFSLTDWTAWCNVRLHPTVRMVLLVDRLPCGEDSGLPAAGALPLLILGIVANDVEASACEIGNKISHSESLVYDTGMRLTIYILVQR